MNDKWRSAKVLRWLRRSGQVLRNPSPSAPSTCNLHCVRETDSPELSLEACREIVAYSSLGIPLHATERWSPGPWIASAVGPAVPQMRGMATRYSNRSIPARYGCCTGATLRISPWGGWHTQGGWQRRGSEVCPPRRNQPDSTSSADVLQYRTSVRLSPTYTNSHTDRVRPSTKGSRWLETNH